MRATSSRERGQTAGLYRNGAAEGSVAAATASRAARASAHVSSRIKTSELDGGDREAPTPTPPCGARSKGERSEALRCALAAWAAAGLAAQLAGLAEPSLRAGGVRCCDDGGERRSATRAASLASDSKRRPSVGAPPRSAASASSTAAADAESSLASAVVCEAGGRAPAPAAAAPAAAAASSSAALLARRRLDA